MNAWMNGEGSLIQAPHFIIIAFHWMCFVSVFHLASFSSGWFRTQSWSFFQTLFSRIGSDYCSVDRVVLLKPISTEPGSREKRELITLTLASSRENMLPFIQRSAGLVGWTVCYEDCQLRIRKKWSEERHAMDMATFFFFLLWTLALNWLPYTSKGPASWKYHEMAHLVPESHKNKIDNATSSG